MFNTSKWSVTGLHIFFFGRAKYDVGKLLKITRRRCPVRVDIEELWGYAGTKRSGFSLRNFYHCNTRYPVIALNSGRLVDGRHRLLKLKAQGRKRCAVVYINRSELEKCRTRARIGKRINPTAN